MYDKSTLPSFVYISEAYCTCQLYAPIFSIFINKRNSKLPDYFITTEWINIKNKSNNEHHQVKKEKEFSLSEQSISSNIYNHLSTSIRYDSIIVSPFYFMLRTLISVINNGENYDIGKRKQNRY
jgi:hypothetical protein